MGAGLSPAFPEWFLSISYTIWLLGAGFAIWKKGKERENIAERFLSIIKAETSLQRCIISFILGLLIGMNAGVFGASSGPLFLLVLVFIMGYSIQKAVGTSTLIMMITATSALSGYWRAGNINLEASLIIAIATIISGVLGVQLAVKANDQLISKIVGAAFMVMGVFQGIYLYF
jgi:uncharacterized membrane protein YfcA